MKKKRKEKSKKKHYFTKDHENAIIEYCLTDDIAIRTELYIKWIGPAFNELVDKITYTYKFTSLPNIRELKDDCKIWLTTILDKYDPNKGSRAFSYFSVITKNWFIHKVKKTSKQKKTEVRYDDVFKDGENENLFAENDFEIYQEKEEFWFYLKQEMNTWDAGALKTNEKKVLEAVRIIFESCDDIEIFNKKAIYLYLRELTGLNTKQVVNNLNKLRIKYKAFKSKWNQGKI
jgi:hypothetical protein